MPYIVDGDITLSQPPTGPLAAQIEGFAGWARDQGYARCSRCRQVLLAACFSLAFPVPLYPQCLQTAHELAELVDFDFWLMQDEITAAIRGHLRDKAHILDEFELHDPDPSAARYD